MLRIFYDIADKNQTQFAKWSPVGHNLIYVYKNNIYYVESPESADNPSAVTTNGIEGVIYNGAADWVYEGKPRFSTTVASIDSYQYDRLIEPVFPP